MSFLNKLFATRPKVPKSHESFCESLFTFNAEQVQVVVFKECDFRGRKLLFDSNSIRKVPCAENQVDENVKKSSIELCNGFAYLLAKPDIQNLEQLKEIVFGSVAMSYTDSIYKIHRTPLTLIFSQIFPSANLRHPHLFQSFDNSTKVGDDSGTFNSNHSNVSATSTHSDTVLLCKKTSNLNVPLMSNSSLICSSGFGEQSNGSVSSTPHSISFESTGGIQNSNTHDFSKSLSSSMNASEDFKPHKRKYKLGLAIVLHNLNNPRLENFLMQHMGILELVFWKLRRGVEMGFLRHRTFVSTVYEIFSNTAQWFVDLLTGPYLKTNLWCKISSCDIVSENSTLLNSRLSSIKNLSPELHLNEGAEDECSRNVNSQYSFSSLKNRFFGKKLDENNLQESFLNELSDLLENFDVKDTNFFLSTLITAILTYHLGWVNTILPKDETTNSFKENVLRKQLRELFGCIGHPKRVVHTILVGDNENNLIDSIIRVLSYFIRCSQFKVQNYEKFSFDEAENEEVELCIQNGSLLKEDCRRFEDHLEEIIRQSETSENCGEKSLHNLAQNLSKSPPKTYNENQIFIKKNKSFLTNLNELSASSKKDSENIKELNFQGEFDTYRGELQEEINDSQQEKRINLKPKSDVLFVLGENEKLENLKTKEFEAIGSTSFSTTTETPKSDSNLNKNIEEHSNSEDSKSKNPNSEEPNFAGPTLEPKSQKKYSGVKFNFQQHPQIFENYMKSKNIEIHPNPMLQEKKLEGISSSNRTFDFSMYNNPSSNFVGDDDDDEEEEILLQTPSNASELESTNELMVMDHLQKPEYVKAKEVVHKIKKSVEFVRRHLKNTILVAEPPRPELKFINLPLPRFKQIQPLTEFERETYANTLIRGFSHNYISNVVLQGVSASTMPNWQTTLKRDLVLNAKHPSIDDNVEESIAIIANTTDWQVQIMSSHTFVTNNNSNGVPVGMSQLVADMLESLVRLWRLRTPSKYCLMHIDQKLEEFCQKSKALAQMLLETDFCSMEQLISTLKLDVNDVPLLLAVASVHTPEVTQKYGLSFQ